MEQTSLVRKKRNKAVMRRREASGIQYLTFPMIEETGAVRHLMSTRLGGVSEGVFSTMNLSFTRGDDEKSVQENFRRIAGVLHASPEDFVCSDQTHTTNIRRVTGEDRGKGVVRPKDYRDVDGLITDEPGIVLATFYADCVPLLLVDPKRRALGLSHSGWRGTVAGMGKKTVDAMAEAFGSRPEDLYAAVGPSICRDCYEVSEDVAEAFADLERRAWFPGDRGSFLTAKGNGKYQLDLWKANELILLGAGVRPEKISVTDVCTCCNPDILFSHRASHGRRGNLGMFAVLNGDEEFA